MSKSKAQEFAQNRNRSGGTLKGVIKNLEKNIKPACTKEESIKLGGAILSLKQVEKQWSNNYENAKDELL